MEKKKQFLPTLLERLIDEEPKKTQEAYDAFYFDSRKMRHIVQKDITALLNNTNIEDLLDENKDKQARASVINYGIAALSGMYASHGNWGIIEKNIRNALLRFETRLIPETLLVRPLLEKDSPAKNGIVIFEIRGLIDWRPNPVDLCIHGTYDIETAKVDLKPS